jgi:hypothetical protein
MKIKLSRFVVFVVGTLILQNYFPTKNPSLQKTKEKFEKFETRENNFKIVE